MTVAHENLLTEKEREVLQMLKLPKMRKEIADELRISINTVNTHIRSLHVKTKTHSLTELVLWKPEREQKKN